MGSGNLPEKLVVAPYNPKRRQRYLVILIVSVVIVAIAGYRQGYEQIEAIYLSVLEERDELLEERELLLEEGRELRQRVANLEQGKAIDVQAQKEVRETIRGLEQNVSQLREDVSFYKEIMAPSGKSKGLQIQKLELAPTADSRRFAYKLVLTQVANNKQYIAGVAVVNFIGSNNGEKEILPLRDISEVTELGVKFRFRYFQDISGELTLPEGFTPEKIQVVAQSKGKKRVRVEQTFDWMMKEGDSDVGQKQKS